MDLSRDILSFLRDSGFRCSHAISEGCELIVAEVGNGSTDDVRTILPVKVEAPDPETAEKQQESLVKAIKEISSTYRTYPLIITEDRWNSRREMMQKRLLAHLEVFFPVYARNCEVRRIDKATAGNFLESNHSYSDASCKYRYGLFLKRHTGHRALTAGQDSPSPGDLIAVATFSSARKWRKGDKEIRSYEWTRYASLSDVRVNGGMGKFLKKFITDVAPDDVMSYADLEWSEGRVYEQLGFSLEGVKEPVTFGIDRRWRRLPVKPAMTESESAMTESESAMTESEPAMTGEMAVAGAGRYLKNFGSNKYRLKLTDYE